ncbi:hypothetical protein SDJN03_23321, partial [Cucurbita argyrosperma subsp. sororia]
MNPSKLIGLRFVYRAKPSEPPIHFRNAADFYLYCYSLSHVVRICSQEIVDLNSSEFLNAFERFRTKAESYILSSFVKIRITAEDSFHVVRLLERNFNIRGGSYELGNTFDGDR